MIDDLLRNDLSFPLLGQRIIAETLNTEVGHFSILSIVNITIIEQYQRRTWKEHGDGDGLDNHDGDDGNDDEEDGDDGDDEDVDDDAKLTCADACHLLVGLT